MQTAGLATAGEIWNSMGGRGEHRSPPNHTIDLALKTKQV
jgi:hypothetical protein